ncbi:MAG: WG repeat-containing protein [Flavobacteriales bacterium]|nr:WG repeat-containing protein [Flavobacteriales bacterium]
MFIAAVLATLCACTTHPNTSTRSTNAHLLVETPHMKYTQVEPANELGYAKVSLGEGETYAEGIIDAKGTEIIPPRTDMLVNDITGSTALVQVGRSFLFVDLGQGPADTALFATTKGYEYAEPFRCGRAMVKVDDRWFYIDTAGNALFNETFDFAETFHHDRAMVKEGDHYRIINTAGKTVAAMRYDQVNPYTATRWQVTKIKGDDYLSGFVDLDGKEAVPLIYTEITMWQPEVKRSRAVIKEKVGFLDELGNVAIPIQYEYAEIFDKGKARVMLNGRQFFIDPMGKEVAE